MHTGGIREQGLPDYFWRWRGESELIDPRCFAISSGQSPITQPHPPDLSKDRRLQVISPFADCSVSRRPPAPVKKFKNGTNHALIGMVQYIIVLFTIPLSGC
jgi:hypothetical protein